jgi:hypothetical protein
MKLAGLTNPISEAWRRASRDDRRQFVDGHEFELMKVRHELAGANCDS